MSENERGRIFVRKFNKELESAGAGSEVTLNEATWAPRFEATIEDLSSRTDLDREPLDFTGGGVINETVFILGEKLSDANPSTYHIQQRVAMDVLGKAADIVRESPDGEERFLNVPFSDLDK